MAIVPTIIGEDWAQNPDGTLTRVAFWELSFDNAFNPPRLDNTRVVVTGPGRYKARGYPFADESRVFESPVVTSDGRDGTQASPWTFQFPKSTGQRFDVEVITRAGLPVVANYQLEFSGPGA